MTYLVSDTNGCNDCFQNLLKTIKFTDNDTMYILGNLVDFGEDSMGLLEDISYRYNIYPIAGDRDFLAARMLHKFDSLLKSGAAPDAQYISEMTSWVQSGGQATLEGFRELSPDMQEGLLDYLSDMPLYEEVTVNDKQYLLLHMGISNYREGMPLEDLEPDAFLSSAFDLFAPPKTKDTTIVIGHVPTPDGGIYVGKNIIGLNCNVIETGKLGCLCLETGRTFYSA